jgi:hypothetical protein
LQQAKDSIKSYNDKIETAKPHLNINRHDEVKKYIKKDSYRQSDQGITNRARTEKSYIKAVTTPKKTYQNRPTSASEKSVHKRSNAKVTRSQKNRGSRTHQNRAKRHN